MKPAVTQLLVVGVLFVCVLSDTMSFNCDGSVVMLWSLARRVSLSCDKHVMFADKLPGIVLIAKLCIIILHFPAPNAFDFLGAAVYTYFETDSSHTFQFVWQRRNQM